jgi:elongation factor P--beta-lysine ligase
MTQLDKKRWTTPNASGKTRKQILEQRHFIKRSVRDYLHEEGFVEIDSPLLVVGTTPDAEIDSFQVGDRYLVTSCEYQIKRIEIGGFDKSYTLTQNFRVGDTGTYRNPEFTMLEWARVGETLKDIEDDVEQFFTRAHRDLGGNSTLLNYQGHKIDITPPWDRLSVRGAIEKYIGTRLDDFTTASLLKAAEAAKIEIKPDWREDGIFLFSLILDHLQHKLGFEKPVFLQEWPKLMTSSADEDATGKFTQRSELFIAGVELSDGFPSLTDYERQKIGFQAQLDRRKEHGSMKVEIDHKFLNAMKEGFPSGAGMALGFDRLVMVLTDQPNIAQVLAFSWDEL